MNRRAEVDSMCRDLARAVNLARERAADADADQARYLLGCARAWQQVAKHRANDRGNCSGCRGASAPCLELSRQHGLATRLVLAPQLT